MRLLVHVEGETEEVFVNEALCPYLLDHGYMAVSARLLGNSRLRSKRGGIRSWESVRADLANHLKQDRGAVATTMVDYYALPGGENGWPGRELASMSAFEAKAAAIEAAIHADLLRVMGDGFAPSRFIPYVTMHEFEGLLFSDCNAFARGLGSAALAPRLAAIRGAFPSPEHINDSRETAPSKRIASISPTYQKPLHGPLAVLEMGVDAIRRECPGFNGWVQRLVDIAA